MASPTKLLLVSCSDRETRDLSQRIFDILREDYGMGSHVELLQSRRVSEVDPEVAKGFRSPLVADFFVDGEVQIDVGMNELKDTIRGKHVALVEHLLTPVRRMFEDSSDYTQMVSVNDHLKTVHGMLDVFRNVDTLQRTLVAPYLTYVRSHSIEKYLKRGLAQYDSLKELLEDFQRKGFNALVAIDLHSMKASTKAEDLQMDVHMANPFQSGRAINVYKLGLSGEKAARVLTRLRPFQERFAQLKKDNPDHLYVISVDDGTETKTENFVERAFPELPPEEVYARIAYLDKERINYRDTKTSFKAFSRINEGNIDSHGTFIIIDDMYASSDTANKAARIFKEHGARRVEVWTSHPVTMPMQHGKANDRNYIDKVVCLNTVPQHPNLQIECIPASADLLAAGLYKAHQKLVASR
ncbi:hypothetical protein J4444_02250 [Candidatus Woesearchaeota archaeon]|nr:hypothetical protein [Candidatus Woesearchaeota archaeon]